MRKLTIVGAVAVLVATFAALSLLPNSASAAPKGVSCVPGEGERGGFHVHGVNVYGTDAPDDIDCSGSTKKVHIYGLGGGDTLIGGEGDDHLIGGDGNDKLFGGPGDDGLHGDDGLFDECTDIAETTTFTGCEDIFDPL